MSSDDLVNRVLAADSKLQRRVNTLAHRINEWAGLGSYQISTLAFLAPTAFAAYISVTQLHQAVTGHNERILLDSFINTGFGIYQIIKNIRLEKLEEARQSGEALVVDSDLLQKKKSLIDWWIFSYVPGKLVYFTFSILDVITIKPPEMFTYHLGLLLAQYFREVDTIKPNKRNAVFNFFENLFPKKSSRGYAGITISPQATQPQ